MHPPLVCKTKLSCLLEYKDFLKYIAQSLFVTWSFLIPQPSCKKYKIKIESWQQTYVNLKSSKIPCCCFLSLQWQNLCRNLVLSWEQTLALISGLRSVTADFVVALLVHPWNKKLDLRLCWKGKKKINHVLSSKALIKTLNTPQKLYHLLLFRIKISSKWFEEEGIERNYQHHLYMYQGKLHLWKYHIYLIIPEFDPTCVLSNIKMREGFLSLLEVCEKFYFKKPQYHCSIHSVAFSFI